MTVGTKSILFGAHCFFIHPWFVALAWWRLYGFPWDARLWVAFFVHDIGYWGKPNMDGKEGEMHPYLGAKLMHRLFDRSFRWRQKVKFYYVCYNCDKLWGQKEGLFYWFKFCLYHSRFLAKSHDMSYSRLCIADKLAFCITPRWFYLICVNWSGEIKEYMKLAEDGKYLIAKIPTNDQVTWHNAVRAYLLNWVAEHKDGKEDLWTPK
jgi:hypothetical protein